jgi:hypothetical protein
MAGWQPVTAARSSSPSVWVERFGSFERDDLHLTLRNETAAPRTTTITTGLSALGMSPPPAGSFSPAIRAREEIGETPLSIHGGRASVAFSITIPPRSTRVVRLSRS